VQAGAKAPWQVWGLRSQVAWARALAVEEQLERALKAWAQLRADATAAHSAHQAAQEENTRRQARVQALEREPVHGPFCMGPWHSAGLRPRFALPPEGL
jgi:hypothetical protein